MKGYAISSAVPEAVITFEMAEAATMSLRRLERWWADVLASSAAWEGIANVDVKWSPLVGDMLGDPEYSVVHVVPSLPDAPQAVAYHTVDEKGRPVCLISWEAVQREGGSLVGPDGLLSAITHEMHEARVDPPCNLRVRMPDGLYTPLETDDWVQGTDYVEPGVPGHYVSNAVGPRFFSIGAQGRLDIRSDVTEPAVTVAFQETPEGYHEVEHPDGTVTQVFGDKFPADKRERILRTGARGGQRARARGSK